MARLNVAKHESVWFDTDIRKALEFDVIGANTFGLWTRLPFLVGDDLNDHAVPELPVIA